MKKFLGLIFLAMGISSAENPADKNELGIVLGWNNPSGAFGLEYNRILFGNQSLGVGLGPSAEGFKYSIGYKFIFLTQYSLQPFIGLSGLYATGSGSPGDTVIFNSYIPSSFSIQPRFGLRCVFSYIDWYFQLGYELYLNHSIIGISDAHVFGAPMTGNWGPEISTALMLHF